MRLSHGRLRATLLPEVGGGLARLDWHDGRRVVPLMRPCDGVPERSPGRPEPNRLACYPLLPWSNRISQGGFTHGGHPVHLAPNREDDPYPIHGSAWQRAWAVEASDARSARLTLEDWLPDGYAYAASMRYALRDDALDISLRVTNIGDVALPFGMGLHPFFPRHAGVRIEAPARGVWLNDGRSPLPSEHVIVPRPWDFSTETTLPEGSLNHAFTGWTGKATIAWPADGLRLHIEAACDDYVIYVPEGEDFFCFEPVDHPIDAVHLPGGAVANGMTELAPLASLTRRFVFRVEATGE